MALELISKFLLILIAIFIVSCECSPDINTPRDVAPDNAANIAIINTTDITELEVKNPDYIIEEKIGNDESNVAYSQVEPFFSFMIFSKSGEAIEILRTPTELQANSRYTGVFFKIGRSYDFMVSENKISNNKSKAFLRFFNLKNDNLEIRFGTDQSELINPYGQSGLITSELGSVEFSIIDLSVGENLYEGFIEMSESINYAVIISETESEPTKVKKVSIK